MKLSEKLKCADMADLADQAERLEQEVEKLKGQYEDLIKLVEAAYREGYDDGGYPIGANAEWRDSRAKKALAKLNSESPEQQ